MPTERQNQWMVEDVIWTIYSLTSLAINETRSHLFV